MQCLASSILRSLPNFPPDSVTAFIFFNRQRLIPPYLPFPVNMRPQPPLQQHLFTILVHHLPFHRCGFWLPRCLYIPSPCFLYSKPSNQPAPHRLPKHPTNLLFHIESSPTKSVHAHISCATLKILFSAIMVSNQFHSTQPIDMGRGSYDTTGVPKPKPPPKKTNKMGRGGYDTTGVTPPKK